LEHKETCLKDEVAIAQWCHTC